MRMLNAVHLLLIFVLLRLTCGEYQEKPIQKQLSPASNHSFISETRFLPKRDMLQIREDESKLICSDLREVYNGTSKEWKIDDRTLRKIENDVQVIVDCSNSGDTILFEPCKIVRPSRTIQVIKDLVLSVWQSEPSSNDTLTSEAENTAHFACPDETKAVFRISSENATLANISIEGCSLRKGTSLIRIKDSGTVRLEHVLFKANTARNRPLIVAKSLRSFFISWSTFAENSGDGSVIFAEESNLIAIASDFFANSGTLSGSALQLVDSKLKIDDSRFENNTSGGYGGSIYASNSTLMVSNSTFLKNSAFKGGSCYVQYSNLTLTNSHFEANKAVVAGGGIRLYGSLIHCSRTDFVNNKALDAGGAVYVESSRDNIWSDTSFLKNSAGNGAAMLLENCSKTVLVNSVRFEGNHAERGGAAAYVNACKITFNNATFTQNSALYGGALFLRSFSTHILNSVFDNNSGGTMGGAISSAQGKASLTRVEFLDNNSDLGGAAFFLTVFLTVSEVSLIDNFATKGAGFHCKSSDVSINPTENLVADIPSSLDLNSETSFGIFGFKNRARNGGGAIDVESSNLNISYSNFSSNVGPEGAAISAISQERTVSICNSVFENNMAEFSGGGIYVRATRKGTTLIISSVDFINCAAERGGAFYLTSVNASINNCYFKNNVAMDGGAAFIEKIKRVLTAKDSGGSVPVIHISFLECNFELNRVNGDGGALLIRGALEAQSQYLNRVEGSVEPHFSSKNITVSLVSVNITNNTANVTGGAIHGQGVNLLMSSITVRGNSAEQGGGFYLKNSSVTLEDSIFFNNVARYTGGGIHIANEEANANISLCSFERNRAGVGGGGLYVEALHNKTELDLNFVTIKNCASLRGGALFLSSVNGSVQNCMFKHNSARIGGAAVIQKNNIVIQDTVTAQDNKRSEGAPSIKVNLKNCSFLRNRSFRFGGALLILGSLHVNSELLEEQSDMTEPDYSKKDFVVVLRSCRLEKNEAGTFGGGIHGHGCNVTMFSTLMTKNRGEQGGGLHLKNSQLRLDESIIHNNGALDGGGGIHLEEESDAEILMTNITKNGAGNGNGGGLNLVGSDVKSQNVIFFENKATSGSGGGVSVVTESREGKDYDSTFLCVNCSFTRNYARKLGGAVNVHSQNTGKPVVAQFLRCLYKNNSAGEFGGGIHFFRSSIKSKCISWKSCGKLVIVNSDFADNSAQISGRALHSSDRKSIHFNCGTSTSSKDSFRFMVEKELIELKGNSRGYCGSWIQSRNQQPPQISSYVRALDISEGRNENWKRSVDGKLAARDVVPGSSLPDLYLQTFDEYGNKHGYCGDINLKATIAFEDSQSYKGSYFADLKNGEGRFSGIRDPTESKDFVGPYRYTLLVSFNVDYLNNKTVYVDVRDCSIGEERKEEGVLCQSCDATQYNLDPVSSKCAICPENMNCTGHYVFPIEDHWHCTPCHNETKKCLASHACEDTKVIIEKIQTENNFTSLKQEIENLTCSFSDEAREQYERVQCKKGYKGILCGSCEKGYCRSLGYSCTKCHDVVTNLLIIVGACFWLIVIVYISVRGSLSSDEQRLSISRTLRHLALKVSICFKKTNSSTQTTAHSTKILPILESHHLNSEQHELSLDSKTTKVPCCPKRNLLVSNVKKTAECQQKPTNQAQMKQEKWKLVEIFKITINFLQAIAVAAVTNVEWRSYMMAMFDFSAFTGGASAALVSRAVQCMPFWKDDISRSIAGLFSGLLLPMFVIVLIVVLFACVAYVASKKVCYFIKRSILGALAVSYFSYLSITRIAIMTLDCVGVSTDKNWLSSNTTYYWTSDTSIQCLDSTHTRLVIFGGFLFLFFSVGFPLVSALLLWHFHNRTSNGAPQWMFDIMGFLYRAYGQKYVYWESVVMLRKSILTIIVVFSYHLGGDTQGLLASFVLVLCLYFQSVCNPYRDELAHLNKYESFSLLLSCTTFSLAQFFMKERTVEIIKTVLSILLLVLNSGFLLFLVVRLCTCFVIIISIKLNACGLQPGDEIGLKSLTKLCTFMSSRIWNRRVKKQDNQDTYNTRLSSIESLV